MATISMSGKLEVHWVEWCTRKPEVETILCERAVRGITEGIVIKGIPNCETGKAFVKGVKAEWRARGAKFSLRGRKPKEGHVYKQNLPPKYAMEWSLYINLGAL